MKMAMSLRIAFLLLFSSTCFADSVTMTLKCSFSEYVDRTTDRETLDKPLEMTFITDPTNEKRAFIKGNNGSSPVTLFMGESYITFVEVTPNNSVQVTAIEIGGTAVHGRHTFLSGNLRPSQYYGACESSYK